MASSIQGSSGHVTVDKAKGTYGLGRLGTENLSKSEKRPPSRNDAELGKDTIHS